MVIDIENIAKEVYTELGPGYSERIYHNAIEVLLRSKGIQYESERIIPIRFRGHVIGNVRADIIINDEIVLELKAIKTLGDGPELQIQNYLNLTGLKIGYLLNFPPHNRREVEVHEFVTEPLKGGLSQVFDKMLEHHHNVTEGRELPRLNIPPPLSYDDTLPPGKTSSRDLIVARP